VTGSSLTGAAAALAAVACMAFAGVAVTEWSYASAHPDAYGPANVIATGAAAGAVLALAVCMLAAGQLRQSRATGSP
jgi:hypothetical protein